MKLKYYLRGLGTGILFATIILFISYSYKMSDKQIKEKALELGMVYPDTEETSSSEASSDDLVADDTTLNEQSTEEQTTNQVSSEEKSSEENTTKEETTQETTKKEETTEETTTKNNTPQKTYELTVTSRTTSIDVSNKLESAGIIDDADKFNDYLCDNGYSSRIQNGTFTVNSSMSYEELAEFIIRKSNAN